MQKLDKSKLVKNLGKRYKLVPFLDKALTTFDAPWEFKYEPKISDSGWHPSGHCMPPVSALYAEAKMLTQEWEVKDSQGGQFEDHVNAKPEALKAETRKAFMVGHYWHQLLQHLSVELGFAGPNDIERRGRKEWGIPNVYYFGGGGDGFRFPKPYHWATGSGDIAPCKLPGGWEGVVDFKTMASAQYKLPDVPPWAADKYKCQINMYMDFFDLEHGLIVAINKDAPHDFKEFEYERDQALIDAIYGKWEFISECLDHDIEITKDDDEHFPLPV
jgi:hypothetical protein